MKQTAKMSHILNVPASPHTPFDFSLQSQFFIWRLGEARVVAPGSHGSCILWGVCLGWRLWTRSPEKHFIYKTDLTAQFVCNAEHSSHAPPLRSCEPWLLLWCQLFHRDLWNGSDEWGPVRLHSLGGLESIHLSVTLPALTVTNTMQASDNTPIHYKKEKRKKKKKNRRDGKSYACHLSMLHSSTLLL